jgi:type II secretory pathway pseudopilin PulG
MLNPRSQLESRGGFTRLELCAATGALLLLVALVVPALAASKPASERAVCFNNLRLFGGAIDRFMAEHDEATPWRTPVSSGGTFVGGLTKPANAWYEFAFLSNSIGTPRVLACPADSAAKVATDFSGTPSSYTSSGMRGNATSYTVSLDVWTATSATLLLSTDLNIRFDGNANCSAGFVNVPSIQAAGINPQVAWTNKVHGTSGHILRADGSVIFTDTDQLRKALRTGDDNGSLHLLPAR